MILRDCLWIIPLNPHMLYFHTHFIGGTMRHGKITFLLICTQIVSGGAQVRWLYIGLTPDRTPGASTGSILFQAQDFKRKGKGGHKASGKSPQNISLESCHCALSTAVTPAPVGLHNTRESSCPLGPFHVRFPPPPMPFLLS